MDFLLPSLSPCTEREEGSSEATPPTRLAVAEERKGEAVCGNGPCHLQHVTQSARKAIDEGATAHYDGCTQRTRGPTSARPSLSTMAWKSYWRFRRVGLPSRHWLMVAERLLREITVLLYGSRVHCRRMFEHKFT
eukprot:TRINITY_DN4099_c1_g1_i1.p1 TRINITY_DN4099_c1_g1~~TRINITY_DN4099_c1_g1_i1.p1  ORF type:complete len:135 (+),score=11.71 TRINITY_DN4099_c1_g1_i1:41-445(+)